MTHPSDEHAPEAPQDARQGHQEEAERIVAQRWTGERHSLVTAIIEALAAAHAAGRREGLEAAAELVAAYRRQHRESNDQPSFHAQGRVAAARSLEAALRARLDEKPE